MHKLFRTTLRWGKYRAWQSIRAISSKKTKAGSVAILYVFAEQGRYPKTRTFVEDYWRWLGDRKTTLVCIDNLSESKEPIQTKKGMWDIGGDNSYREFSGWRKGLRFVENLVQHPDIIVFANDACLNYADVGLDPLFYRLRFDKRTIAAASEKGLVGIVDQAPNQQILLGQDVTSWVRSNFFCLPSRLASALPWVFIPDDILNCILPLHYQGTMVNATPHTNENLREFLNIWITQRWRWAAQPTTETWPLLRNKLTAILNERMLSGTVRKLGYDIVEASRLKWI